MYVAYATRTLELGWLPESARVVVVHNDHVLDRGSIAHEDVVHVDGHGNVGFGAAVNLALPLVDTERTILCNPDVVLGPVHWDALVDASPDEVATVPLVDDAGVPTSVTSAYPTPLGHIVSGYRLGRLAPRGGRMRRVASRRLGRWGREHLASLDHPVGTWPLAERWVSGAVLSVDTDRLRAVRGFDERHFLYYEDVDLCARLATRFPGARVRVADVPWGTHRVGTSAGRSPDRRRSVEAARLASAITYARGRTGPGWSTAERLLTARARWMERAR